MTGGVPESEMHFSGEPTSDGDNAAEYLRVWYDENCPELHLGGWREALDRWVRRVFFGFRDYDLDRDRHNLMLGLLNEVGRINAEDARQAAARVCHEDQMTVWAGEVVGRLSMGDYLNEDLSYDDVLAVHSAVADELRGIVESAFTHPEKAGQLP